MDVQTDDPMIRLSMELGVIVSVIPVRDGLPPVDFAGFSRTCHYGPPDADQVRTAIAYLSRLRPTKRPTFNSYVLKHRAEDWGRKVGLESYVSNGALIAAAISLNLKVEPHGINAVIGVSKRDVRALKAR